MEVLESSSRFQSHSEMILPLLTHLVRNKHRSHPDLELFSGKSIVHTERSKFFGVTSASGLALVDLLMALPSVSESKAAAVVRHVGTLRGLMEAFKSGGPDALKDV